MLNSDWYLVSLPGSLFNRDAGTDVVPWGGYAQVVLTISRDVFPQIPQLERIPQSERPVLSIPVASLNQTVFAPTAAMIYQFREVALHARHTRVAGYEQPLFAWQ